MAWHTVLCVCDSNGRALFNFSKVDNSTMSNRTASVISIFLFLRFRKKKIVCFLLKSEYEKEKKKIIHKRFARVGSCSHERTIQSRTKIINK